MRAQQGDALRCRPSMPARRPTSRTRRHPRRRCTGRASTATRRVRAPRRERRQADVTNLFRQSALQVLHLRGRHQGRRDPPRRRRRPPARGPDLRLGDPLRQTREAAATTPRCTASSPPPPAAPPTPPPPPPPPLPMAPRRRRARRRACRRAPAAAARRRPPPLVVVGPPPLGEFGACVSCETVCNSALDWLAHKSTQDHRGDDARACCVVERAAAAVFAAELPRQLAAGGRMTQPLSVLDDLCYLAACVPAPSRARSPSGQLRPLPRDDHVRRCRACPHTPAIAEHPGGTLGTPAGAVVATDKRMPTAGRPPAAMAAAEPSYRREPVVAAVKGAMPAEIRQLHLPRYPRRSHARRADRHAGSDDAAPRIVAATGPALRSRARPRRHRAPPARRPGKRPPAPTSASASVAGSLPGSSARTPAQPSTPQAAAAAALSAAATTGAAASSSSSAGAAASGPPPIFAVGPRQPRRAPSSVSVRCAIRRAGSTRWRSAAMPSAAMADISDDEEDRSAGDPGMVGWCRPTASWSTSSKTRRSRTICGTCSRTRAPPSSCSLAGRRAARSARVRARRPRASTFWRGGQGRQGRST